MLPPRAINVIYFEMTIRVANAPCSWGILEFEGMADSLPWSVVLDEMAASGYEGTELGDWGFMPTDPGVLSSELGRRDLSLLGAFVPIALISEQALEAGLQEALKIARLLATVGDQPWIVLADENGVEADRTRYAGRIRAEHRLEQSAMRRFCMRANNVARVVYNETGLKTVFHHHCGGFVETPDEIDALLEYSEPDWLGLCLDTGHIHYGGGDALTALKRYGSRVWHVHFKDCDHQVARQARADQLNYFEAVQNGVFCELGKGEVNFKEMLSDLNAQGYQGWIVVEQDVLPGMGTPFETAQRNRKYLETLGL